MKAESVLHEHTSEGPSRNERRIRKTAEGLGYSIGVLEDTDKEFSFQVLNDTYDNMDKAEYTSFLTEFLNYDDIATLENTEIQDDPQHGLYLRINLAQ